MKIGSGSGIWLKLNRTWTIPREFAWDILQSASQHLNKIDPSTLHHVGLYLETDHQHNMCQLRFLLECQCSENTRSELTLLLDQTVQRIDQLSIHPTSNSESGRSQNSLDKEKP